MIQAATNEPFEALLLSALAGRLATTRIEVYDPSDGRQITTPTNQGITEPRPGTYRAELTVTEVGDFLVRWTDVSDPANPELLGEEDLYVYTVLPVPAAGDYIPSVEEVGGLLRTRTVDEGGHERGTFTEHTAPTGTQVQGMIQRATTTVIGKVGLPIPNAQLEQAVRSLITLRAAMLVELTYFPEQVGTDESPYDRYRELYNDDLPGVIEAVNEARGGTGQGGASAASPGGSLPLYSFPVSDGTDYLPE